MELPLNPVLETRATSVEGILYWSYGISNRSGYHSPQITGETPGRSFLRLNDLRVEAAMIHAAIYRELRWPHLRAIIEAKYGERQAAVQTCAEILKETARTQTIAQLVRIVESYIEWHKLSTAEAASMLALSYRKGATMKTRYEGILEGWHMLALRVVTEVFQEKGWVA
jgi:hypothetical protein